MGFFDQTEDFRMISHILHSVFVYAACTEAGYVKVGISGAPLERVYQIHLGSPSPVKAAQWVYIGSFQNGRKVEKLIKQQWKSRNSRGEWYLFDYSIQADKQDFHDTLAAVIEVVTGSKPQWEKIGPEKVKDLIKAGELAMAQKAIKRGKHPWRGVGLVSDARKS